jgi:transposase
LADHVPVAWGGEKMSKHSVPASDVSALLRRFTELRRKAAARTGRNFPIIVIQEAGLDGFWIHRVLQSEGIESHVVDAASILTSRLDPARAGVGERRPTGSMARPWCAP